MLVEVDLQDFNGLNQLIEQIKPTKLINPLDQVLFINLFGTLSKLLIPLMQFLII